MVKILDIYYEGEEPEMKRITVFLVLVMLILAAVMPVGAAPAPEISLDYLGGNVITKTHDEGLAAGVGFGDDVKNTTELGGYLLGLRYPTPAFSFSLEYGSGETKDVDGKKRDTSLG